MAILEDKVHTTESAASSEDCKEVHATALPSSTIVRNSFLDSEGNSSLYFCMEFQKLKLYLLRMPAD